MIYARRVRTRNRFHGAIFTDAVIAVAILLLAANSFGALSQADTARQAIQLMQAGKFHDAELLWRQVVQADPKSAAAHANLGVTLSALDDISQAAAQYRKSLQLEPNQPGVSFDLGVAEFRQGHFAEAIPPLEAVRKKHDDPRLPLLIGMSYFGLHEYGRAVPLLTQASAAQPRNLELHRVLANSCLWSSNYDCALSEFKTILTTNPDSAQAHMMMAEALDAMGRTPEALEELRAGERLSPTEPMLHFELGYLEYKQHDLQNATLEFKREVELNPGSALAYAYLGDIALQNNDNIKAAELLKKSINLQNDLRLAYFDLGCVDENQNHDQDAIHSFERAEALDPSQPDAHYRLARLYRATGQHQKAQAEFAKTRSLHAKRQDTLIQQVSGANQTQSP
jgi:tetratricopeptide (TPR) repeat protein